MGEVYCPICGGIRWVEELGENIIDPHDDCLNAYLEIEKKEIKDSFDIRRRDDFLW